MKSELFSALPDVNFAEKDPSQIESEIIKRYEDETSRTLARGDPVRLLLNAIILAMIQQRNIIDIAAKNNLLAYASGDYLDHIGSMLGVSRLDASHSVCTLKFTLSDSFPFNIIIPEGTRVCAGDGKTFSVSEQAVIKAGEVSCEVIASCTESGETGNGYVAGQINRLVDVFPYEMKVTNVNASYGGSDKENDENFRERIQIAPESFSSAGPKSAYEFFARSADEDIIDVSVLGPPDTQPGHVEIYVLMTDGNLPGDEILKKVHDICNAKDIRPDTDFVSVKKPEVIKYQVEIKFWIDEKFSGSVNAIQERVKEAVDAWVKWEKTKLGRDINVSELTKRIIEAGAKRCDIINPNFRKLSSRQISICENISMIYAGLEEA